MVSLQPFLATEPPLKLEEPAIHDSEKVLLKPVSGQASLLGSSVSIATTCIGSGLLALPFSYSSVGVGLGTSLLFGSASWSIFASHLLCRCCDWSQRFSYDAIAVVALGHRGATVLRCLMVLLLFGVMTSLLVIVGDSLEFMSNDVAGELPWALPVAPGWNWGKMPLLCMTVLCVVLPLSCCRNVNSLVRTSTIAFGCTCVVATALMYLGLVTPNGVEAVTNVPAFILSPSVFKALPIIMLSFGCQINVPEIYAGLTRRSIRRMDGCLLAAASLDGVIYVAVAIFGIMAVGQTVPGNVLKGFAAGDRVALCMNVAMAISATLVYPMLCIPCRSTLLNFVGQGTFGVSAARLPEVLFTMGTVAATLMSALMVPDLAVVMGFTGATAGSLTCYLLPVIFYLKLRRGQPRAIRASTHYEAFVAMVGLFFIVPVIVATQIYTCISAIH